MKELGETRRLSLREVFESEPTEFTPWLSVNLDRLPAELGFELEHDDTEVSAGDFRADIRAKATDGRIVVIENQFNRTDHGHLGQLLTYAAGIEADVVIWIAERVRDEHRAALDWLNDNAEDADFFGVEARVVQIDESRPAVFWDIVSSPNDWSRTAKQSKLTGQHSETEQLRIDYWTAFNSYIEEKGVELTQFKPTKEGWQTAMVQEMKISNFAPLNLGAN